MRTILINLFFLTSLVAGLLTSGCSVYKVSVQQGNVIEQEQLTKVKIGMTKKQVTFLMGNPLLTDPFHTGTMTEPERWDYLYSIKPGGEKTTRQVVTLFFENNILIKIDNSKQERQTLDD